MDFNDLILNRQSCRSYDIKKEVSKEDILYCLNAARLAPSACNSQPWNFTVCMGDKAKAIAKETQSMGMNKFASEAPCLIVVWEGEYAPSAAAGAKVKDQDYKSVDIGGAVAYLTLAATQKGLSSCILGWFDEKNIKQQLNIKNRVRLVICLGYAKEDDKLREKKRKAIEEIVRF